MKSVLIVLGILCLSSVLRGAPEEDLVAKLPGFDPFPYKFYSGYLDVAGTERKLHYIFAESQNSPKDDPVLLWLSGGPGFSSLAGAFSENGPIINRDNTRDGFNYNPWGWNKKTNALWLESPAGVGFSMVGPDNDYSNNDMLAAEQNYSALQHFFQKFPEYLPNDFYISGESYGGIYVPTLAYEVVENNKKLASASKINLKGILVGNGVTNWKYDCNPATVEMALTHALVSDATAAEWAKNGCTAPNGGNLAGVFELASPAIEHSVCDDLTAKIFNEDLKNINLYGIYSSCALGADEQIPCLSFSILQEYFNEPSVRKALHIDPKSDKWIAQSDKVFNHYTKDFAKGSVWTYPILIENGIRCLFYSGDTDLSVPVIGSQRWIDALNLGVKKEWAQWHVDGQVAGFRKVFDGITFVTVRGAGHMVPQYKPQEAWTILDTFIQGKDLE